MSDIPSPTPANVRSARERAGHTQTEASRVVHFSHYQRWTDAERDDGPGLRDLAKWELYLIVTGQHPKFGPRDAESHERGGSGLAQTN